MLVVVKGVLLVGGSGSRLKPLTHVINKHLLPVYNKPLFYYPLSTLILAGADEICFVCNPQDIELFQSYFGNGESLGVRFVYQIQKKPTGIASAILEAKPFLSGDDFWLALGDNLLHGSAVGESLRTDGGSKVRIFTKKVADASQFGVLTQGSTADQKHIEEKPASAVSKDAVVGLYRLSNHSLELASGLDPSGRGEVEISDLLNLHLAKNECDVTQLPRGTAWLDAGTVEDLARAGTYVELLERRQGELIGSPEEVCLRMGLLDNKGFRSLISSYPPTHYTKSLERVLNF